MEGTNKTEANRHKNYRLKKNTHLASCHDYCAERDFTVQSQKNKIRKLRRKNKRLRKENDQLRRLVTKHKGQEEKDEVPLQEKESVYHAALMQDDINGGATSDGQLSSVTTQQQKIGNGKDKEVQADKPVGQHCATPWENQVDIATHAFPEEMFQDPGNSDEVQQYWRDQYIEDRMSPTFPQIPNLDHDDGALRSVVENLFPVVDFSPYDVDMFDGRLS